MYLMNQGPIRLHPSFPEPYHAFRYWEEINRPKPGSRPFARKLYYLPSSLKSRARPSNSLATSNVQPLVCPNYVLKAWCKGKGADADPSKDGEKKFHHRQEFIHGTLSTKPPWTAQSGKTKPREFAICSLRKSRHMMMVLYKS